MSFLALKADELRPGRRVVCWIGRSIEGVVKEGDDASFVIERLIALSCSEEGASRAQSSAI